MRSRASSSTRTWNKVRKSSNRFYRPAKGFKLDVWTKQIDVTMQVKNKGVELEVREPKGGTFLSDFVVTKSGVTCCRGNTSRENGVKLNWKRFIALMEAD